eukprot:403332773
MTQAKQALTVLIVGVYFIFSTFVTSKSQSNFKVYLKNTLPANSAAKFNGEDNEQLRNLQSVKESETQQFKDGNPLLIEQLQQVNCGGKQQTNFTDGKEHMKWLQKITDEARLKYIQKIEREVQLAGRIANQQSQEALYNQRSKQLPTFKSIQDELYCKFKFGLIL